METVHGLYQPAIGFKDAWYPHSGSFDQSDFLYNEFRVDDQAGDVVYGYGP